MKERFSRQLRLRSGDEQVWNVLLDVPRVASWITIVGSVEEVIRLERYRAVLQDRVGPFRLRADLDIRVLELEHGRWIRATAAGEDRQVGSRISVEALLRTSGGPEGTSVSVDGELEVTGRVASLGAGTIRKKADRILQEFCDSAEACLG